MTPRRQPRNLLYTGDNLYILNGINSDSVDLIYLDPPFNSKRSFSAPIGSRAAGASFKDMWTWKDVDEAYLERMVNNYPYLVKFIQSIEVLHGKAMMAYVTYMAQRILELHRVLKPTGSLYLHCDATASHYLKILLDRVFGKNNFRNEIVWKYGKVSNSKAKKFLREHDVILFYAKTSKAFYQPLYYSEPSERVRQLIRAGYNTKIMDGKRYLYIYDNKVVKKKEKAGKINRDDFDIVKFVDTNRGNRFTDVFQVDILNSRSKENTGYPTQKPLALLRRIVESSSDKGDIVLDPFCGCATTMVAAQQLGRRWIGIDIEKKSADLVVSRLSSDAGLFSDFVHRTDVPVRTDVKIVDLSEANNRRNIKKRLAKEFGPKCRGCGMEHYENLEIDHVVPKSKGGQDTYGNYQLLCGNCNRIKGNRTMDFLRTKIDAIDDLLRKQITFGR